MLFILLRTEGNVITIFADPIILPLAFLLPNAFCENVNRCIHKLWMHAYVMDPWIDRAISCICSHSENASGFARVKEIFFWCSLHTATIYDGKWIVRRFVNRRCSVRSQRAYLFVPMRVTDFSFNSSIIHQNVVTLTKSHLRDVWNVKHRICLLLTSSLSDKSLCRQSIDVLMTYPEIKPMNVANNVTISDAHWLRLLCWGPTHVFDSSHATAY